MCWLSNRWRSRTCPSEMDPVLQTLVKNPFSYFFYNEKLSKVSLYNGCLYWWTILKFYTRPQRTQAYMINVLENQWLSVENMPLRNGPSSPNFGEEPMFMFFCSEKMSQLNGCLCWWMILEFYTRPQRGQFYINVLENQWLSVTCIHV